MDVKDEVLRMTTFVLGRRIGMMDEDLFDARVFRLNENG